LYAVESEKTLIVNSLARYGPAELAGVLQGDKVVGVGKENVSTLSHFLRSVWNLGAAGISVPVIINRNGNNLQLVINSIDRNDFLFKPPTH
jgi:S1-C subfamily serine protease